MHNNDEMPTILIVDDVPLNITILADTLKDDYRIKVATSGDKALDICNNDAQPDLILLDVMMPEMDGYEVCRRLKEQETTRDIPIIFITAKDDMRDEEYGLNLGAVDYISKPFSTAIAKARIRNHLNLKLKTDLLNKLTATDGLTGIANRRNFDERLSREWRRVIQYQIDISLLMIDVDYFKPYNDNYGHGAGDECLKRVAKALSSQIQRSSDLLARYGGEEFVVLLPDTNSESAQRFAENLRKTIDELNIKHEYSNAADHVTISIGCATLQPDNRSMQALMDQSDANLYQAKENGRNCVYAD